MSGRRASTRARAALRRESRRRRRRSRDGRGGVVGSQVPLRGEDAVTSRRRNRRRPGRSRAAALSGLRCDLACGFPLIYDLPVPRERVLHAVLKPGSSLLGNDDGAAGVIVLRQNRPCSSDRAARRVARLPSPRRHQQRGASVPSSITLRASSTSPSSSSRSSWST